MRRTLARVLRALAVRLDPGHGWYDHGGSYGPPERSYTVTYNVPPVAAADITASLRYLATRYGR